MKLVLAAIISVFLTMSQASAQEKRRTLFSNCMAVAQNLLKIIPASTTLTFAQKRSDYTVEITYVGHSTYRIETPDNVAIATDFTGEAGLGRLPDVVTMNHAHTSHFTHFPDPKIPHVLRGWGKEGEPADHYVEVGENIIRNVTTDINSNFSGYEPHGNSIFIFETAGLCIGHLGHLHQVLTDAHYAEIGRIDILMVPVDGGHTMSLDNMIKVVRRMRSSVILPMHWFSGYSLTRFLAKMQNTFPVDRRSNSKVSISLNTLPREPTIIVLQPQTSVGQSYE